MNQPISINEALKQVRDRYGLWSEADEKRLDAKRAADEAAHAAWTARNPQPTEEENEE